MKTSEGLLRSVDPPQTTDRRSGRITQQALTIRRSFLMGFLFYAMLERLGIGAYGRLAVLSRFLGGFTTFSTFSIEALTLAQRGNPGLNALDVALSVGWPFWRRTRHPPRAPL